MPNREGGYGGYQSSQPQQNRMPRKVNAPGSGKVRRGVDPAGSFTKLQLPFPCRK